MKLGRDAFAHHAFRDDTVHDPVAQLVYAAVSGRACHSNAHVDALGAKARDEMLAHTLGIGPDPVSLVQHHELPPKARCPAPKVFVVE